MHETVRGAHGDLYRLTGGGDRVGIVEVQSDTDQARVIYGGAGQRSQSLQSLFG